VAPAWLGRQRLAKAGQRERARYQSISGRRRAARAVNQRQKRHRDGVGEVAGLEQLFMDPDKITVGTLIVLKRGPTGVVTHIASDDDPAVSAAHQFASDSDEGAMIQAAYEEIADARPPSS
jgi:hypothetical protein